ncbi:hypothetical protein QN277_023068 [Acacia crassicarpa]|uniref:TIR domain-containing protein n=1 Tax=Acacia crassicarpa TaxID=499986 RepID=A0AAE1MJD8_9FABA|nr:hypothetical protein QN277_023068 [Acacia crassicarpa]
MSSCSLESDFEYHAFLTFSHATPEMTIGFENYFRDVGIKTLIDDQMEDFPRHKISRCRMLVFVLTPGFLRSTYKFQNRLENLWQCQKLQNKRVVAVLWRVSEKQVREQLMGPSILFESSLVSKFRAQYGWILDSATAIAEVASLSDLGSTVRLSSSLWRKSSSSRVSEVVEELAWVLCLEGV